MTKMPKVFETACGVYQVIESIGDGGSGIVYKAQDSSGDFCAIKCLNSSYVTKIKLARFQNELSFCFRNRHENIIKVIDFGNTADGKKSLPFYVMPYYPKTLRHLMEEGIRPDGILPLFTQILDGVEAAHLKGTWHRDLKPENVLCDQSHKVLVVADFGIAHFAEEELQTPVETRPSDRLANFQYAAPEQKERGRSVDQRADIYALGVILNELFTGELLQGTGYTKIASVDPAHAYLDELVDMMVRQSPDDRLQTIDLVKQNLSRLSAQFISRQKVSRLSRTVIPASEIDDPLITDPVHLVDFDYLPDNERGGRLVLRLSQTVNPKWVDCFRNIDFRHSLNYDPPSRFAIGSDQEASIRIPSENRAQEVIDDFKRYLGMTARKYKRTLEMEQRQREVAEKQRLADALERENRRLRVLGSLKV